MARRARLRCRALPQDGRPRTRRIVADLARRGGVAIDWRSHATIGVPVTLLSLAVVWAALMLAG